MIYFIELTLYYIGHGMQIWDVTLVHTLSFEWMVVGNMQDFAKIALQAVFQHLAKHVALRLWHRLLTHSVSPD